jgi:hypothetical protein
MRIVLAVLAGLLLAAPSARADGSDRGAELERWRGRYCTPLGCGPPRAASLAGMAGFGAAVLGAAWLSRRPPR